MPQPSHPGQTGGRVETMIATRADLERARRSARQTALGLGFDDAGAERVTLAVSELATNLLKYAREGRIVTTVLVGPRVGLQIESVDAGPGIPDIPSAVRDGYSTAGGLGGGLPALHRLMDDVVIESGPSGTNITVRTWLPSPS